MRGRTLNKQQRDERKALKSEAKKLKQEERAKNKLAKRLEREEETKKNCTKDYEDDKFFREIREEPTIIKQFLKESRKALKKAQRGNDEDEIEFYKKKVEEYEKSLEAETDKAIMLTYQRYNKEEEATSRLDLHGLRKAEAMRLLDKIMTLRIKQIECQYGSKEGREAMEMNIVTGRGSHTGRAVLKMATKDWLLDKGIQYKEFSNGAGYTALL